MRRWCCTQRQPGDNSALQLLLSDFTDFRFPPIVDPPARLAVSTPGLKDFLADYLGGVSTPRRETSVNRPGMAALRGYLASGEAVAFLGPGASVPLYPQADRLVEELVHAASGRMGAQEAATCQALARDSSDEAVEVVRQTLGTGVYREVLRDVLRARTDPESGRSWTPVQELVCRCPLKR